MTQNAPTEQIIELQLGISFVNTILAALDELPHKHSRRVLDEVVRQAQAQQPQQQQQQPATMQSPVTDVVQ